MTVLNRRYLSLLCLAALSGFGFSPVSHAQTLTSEGHAAGAQCGAADINDNGEAVGACSPGNGTGASVAWAAVLLGTQTPLQALVSGQPCATGGVTDGGLIVGSCRDANNNHFAIEWSSPGGAPAKLAPLALGVLGLTLGDVSSSATGYNQNGGVIGESISEKGDGTGVLWPAGSTAPVPVSAAGDNCVPADVTATLVNSYPTIVLNCPNSSVPGTVTANYAQYGLLGYGMAPLAIPGGYSYCEVSGINDANQSVGTCHTTAPDHPNAVFWSSPTSTPALLNLSGNPRNAGGEINARGDFTFSYQTADGKPGVGVLILSSNIAYLIQATACGGTHVSIAGLGDNEMVALNCENSEENVEAAYWTVSGGVVPLGDEGGGLESALSTISKNGVFTVGDAENSGQTDDAVEATLP